MPVIRTARPPINVFFEGDTLVTVLPSDTGLGTHTRWTHRSPTQPKDAPRFDLPEFYSMSAPSSPTHSSPLTPLSSSPESTISERRPLTPRQAPPVLTRRASAQTLTRSRKAFERVAFWTKDVTCAAEGVPDGRAAEVERMRVGRERVQAEEKGRDRVQSVFATQLGILREGNGGAGEGGWNAWEEEDTVMGKEFWQGEEFLIEDSDSEGTRDSDSEAIGDSDSETSDYCMVGYEGDSEAATMEVAEASPPKTGQVKQNFRAAEGYFVSTGGNGVYVPKQIQPGIELLGRGIGKHRLLRKQSTELLL